MTNVPFSEESVLRNKRRGSVKKRKSWNRLSWKFYGSIEIRYRNVYENLEEEEENLLKIRKLKEELSGLKEKLKELPGALTQWKKWISSKDFYFDTLVSMPQFHDPIGHFLVNMGAEEDPGVKRSDHTVSFNDTVYIEIYPSFFRDFHALNEDRKEEHKIFVEMKRISKEIEKLRSKKFEPKVERYEYFESEPNLRPYKSPRNLSKYVSEITLLGDEVNHEAELKFNSEQRELDSLSEKYIYNYKKSLKFKSLKINYDYLQDLTNPPLNESDNEHSVQFTESSRYPNMDEYDLVAAYAYSQNLDKALPKFKDEYQYAERGWYEQQIEEWGAAEDYIPLETPYKNSWKILDKLESKRFMTKHEKNRMQPQKV
jgi:hypothetical protein